MCTFVSETDREYNGKEISIMGTGIISAIIGLFCTIVTSVVTFFLTRRKFNSEVDAQQIKNMSDSFDTYKKMMETNLATQKETMEVVIMSQNQKIDLLQKENDSLKTQVSQLQQQMINILGSICLDATCKLRKMDFQSDVKFSDAGVEVGTKKRTKKG
jgi:intracellular sulfur oxidation DsrE/DsrF family protein